MFLLPSPWPVCNPEFSPCRIPTACASVDPIPTSSATQRPHVPTSSQANNCQICPCPTCLLHPALTVQPPKLMPTTASAYNSQHSPQPVPTTANTHHSQCPPQPTPTTANAHHSQHSPQLRSSANSTLYLFLPRVLVIQERTPLLSLQSCLLHNWLMGL